MGSYCELYVSKFPISTSKNAVDPLILSIFQPEDLKIFERNIDERLPNEGVTFEDDEAIERAVQYVNKVKNIKDRLNLIGFTLKRVEEAFENSKADILTYLNDHLQNPHFNSNESIIAKIAAEISLLEASELKDFLQAVREIIENNLGKNALIDDTDKTDNKLAKYLLEDRFGLDKFPTDYDPRTLLRAVLEVTDPDILLTYDITDVVYAGYYEDDPNTIYETTIQSISLDYEIGDKFIILTEGSSDIQILSSSINILYPHLAGYFSFMDFGISNASGSANALIATVRSFVGAKIQNKIIAIFDNDTAGEAAIKNLSRTLIPDSIKIVQYPNIPLLDDYPTLGPSGITNMNINGMAGSIEMYLGKDTLSFDGGLLPIQWKGYDAALNKYQGEIIEKSNVQSIFERRIRRCIENPDQIKNYDWTGIESIFAVIFNQFNK